MRRRSVAPNRTDVLSLAVPTAEATRVVELAASVFDEGDFVASVERMVLFRPKLKKSDGDAFVKELVAQIKASKDTLKMMLNKKDQLVDACKTLEEEMVADALAMARSGTSVHMASVVLFAFRSFLLSGELAYPLGRTRKTRLENP